MNAKQISRVKRDYRYFEARNRCELPGMPADIDSCRHQAYRLWAQLAPQFRGSGTEPDFIIESDFIDTIANELYAGIMQDHGLREQQEAVREITDAGDTLRYSLKRTKAPVDITCVQGDPVDEHLVRTYRQYYCKDLEQDIKECFWQYSPLLAAAAYRQSRRNYFSDNLIQVHIHICVNEDDIYTLTTDAMRFDDVNSLRVSYSLNLMGIQEIATRISREHGQHPLNVLDVSFAI